jgi:H+/Cl- antiporter ClcA
LFGLISDLTITIVHAIGNWVKKELVMGYMKKAFIGGMFLIGLALLFGDQYLGLGMQQIGNSINNPTGGGVHWYDFFLKIIFTGLSLGFGGSGGVITPLFFIGSTSGNAIGHLLNGNIQFFAAIGLVSIIAGAANTPIAAAIMALELFGIQSAHYAAISGIIAYLITGHRSIYPSQILAFKKSQYLEVPTGHDMEHTRVEGTKSVTLNRLRERWQQKKGLKENKTDTTE